MKNKNKISLCKRDLWLAHFLNSSNPKTFLNRKESARAAGYKTGKEASLEAIGHENFRKLSDRIEAWLQDEGINNNVLKIKLIQLMEAKETKFFQHEGKVTDQREVEAIETQRRTLDMALKVKGMYAPAKNELTGKNGEPLDTRIVIELVRPEHHFED